MTATRKRTMITCLSITPLFLATSPLARQITATEIAIDPRATYLRTNLDAGALPATAIGLSTLSIVPGNILRLELVGDFDCGGPCVDDRIAMIGMFSASSTLLSPNQPDRVPDAIEAGQDFATSPTHFGSLPTDIPEDFLIVDTIIVAPVAATQLFITAHDSLYNDNSDPDGDFAVRVTVLPGLPGDYNQNGTVDAADYVVWRKNLGSSMTLPNDDTAGVGPDDYARWRTNYGQTAGAGAVTANAANYAVPEPAPCVLLLLTVSVLLLRRRTMALPVSRLVRV
jgi:hypothetical protein